MPKINNTERVRPMLAKKAVSTYSIPNLEIKNVDITVIAAKTGDKPSTTAAKIIPNLFAFFMNTII
jgi:hypothetical protein